MNIQGLEFLSITAELEDASDADLQFICQTLVELMNDADRIWEALPQCPQNDGDAPADPGYFGDPSSS